MYTHNLRTGFRARLLMTRFIKRYRIHIKLVWAKIFKEIYMKIRKKTMLPPHPLKTGRRGAWVKFAIIAIIAIVGFGFGLSACDETLSDTDSDTDTVSVKGVTLNKTTLMLTIGNTETLIASVTPTNAAIKTVTWESNNSSVAAVKDGQVTAVSAGEAIIKVTTTDGKFTAECKVTVNDGRVKGVSLNHNHIFLGVGEMNTLAASIIPINATDKTVTWESNNTAVAKVEGGLVTAVSIGEAAIKVTTTDGGFTAECKVTVVSNIIHVTDVTLNKTAVTLNIGDTETLTAAVTPNNATIKTVTWESSDTDVAEVEDGLVTAVGAGEAIITVTTDDGDFTAECTVTVAAEVINVTGVSLDKNEIFLGKNNSHTLIASVLPVNANNKTVTWESSNTNVAEVEDGLVTAVSNGEAIIKVTTTDGGFTAECNIKVLGVTTSGLKFTLIYGDTYSVSADTNLTDTIVIIPEEYWGRKVTVIQDKAFSNITSITHIVIPDSVTRIGNTAFDGCTSLTSVNIPAGVTVIDYYLFRGCTSLTSVNIPAGVTSFGPYAFYGCTSLTSINIPAGVTSIDSYMFQNCTSLTSIEIPAGVTSIGNYAFNGCTSLTSVIIPAGVTINRYAFSGCTGLENIEILANVSIGLAAFEKCTSLTDLIIHSGVKFTDNGHFSDCTSLTNLIIHSGVTSIGNGAFSGCTSLTSVNIPDSVTSIGNTAFSGCTSLTSVNIPDSVTSIDYSVFRNCTSLTSVNIPDSVTSIDNNAFSGCTGLTSIEIPAGVTSIGSGAFSRCTSLTSVNIPAGVTSIGSYMFENCTSLTSIEIPAGVTDIGSYAFSGCTGLTSIEIPAGVTSIDRYAFQNCTGLVKVVFNGTITSANFHSYTLFPGDLRDKYLAGGIGTYTRPSGSSTTWTKQS